jgi:hypothetical protein
MAQKSLHKWVGKLKCGRTTCNNEEQSGWPLTSCPYYHHADVDTMIKENQWIMVSDIALTVGKRYGSACVIIINNLDCHEVCARWVPQQLIEDHR